uniref:Uncharacterized protein n=1 Tax=Strigamia maritima TaxID=126957 RepID=T1JJB3_STRMM
MSGQRLPSITYLKYIKHREYNEPNNLGVSLMKDRLYCARNLYRKDLYSHYGCVNAIEFSTDGEWLVSGGDDRRVLAWNVEKALQGKDAPICMKGEHNSNIFCLGFDNNKTKIFSAGNDEQVLVHDFELGRTLDVFLHEEAVYGLSVDPLNDNVFASACEDGRILIWDIREPSSTEPFCLAAYTSAFHAVMYNPVEPRLLATANSKEGVSLWDIRAPKKGCLLKDNSNVPSESCMSVRFNNTGTRILALRRRLPPVLYNVQSNKPICQFDHREYYNSCTMKSCCFAGDKDQFILSGSDDFNLYMWKIPDEGSGVTWVNEAHMVLKGHRSIVNQVRFNPSNFLLASSGVEKIVKVDADFNANVLQLWSPFPVPNSTGGLQLSCLNEDRERKVYSHEEYISLILQSGQVMSHDYSQKSTLEDPRMMAFFDSLVQREIEGWNSDASFSSANAEPWLLGGPEDVDISDASSETSSEGEMGIQGRGLSPLTVAYVSAISNVNRNEEQRNAINDLEDEVLPQNSNGNVTSNRISQLIAQKRQRMKQKPRRSKRVRRSKCTSRSSSLQVGEVQPRPRIEDSTTENENWESDPDLNTQQKDGSVNCITDKSEGDSVSVSHPSTSATPTTSNGVCRTLRSNDSGASASDAETPVETSEGQSADTGTPDSGIASNVCENGERESGETNVPSEVSAWVQFKRIRNRLHRACRNYRTWSSDNE